MAETNCNNWNENLLERVVVVIRLSGYVLLFWKITDIVVLFEFIKKLQSSAWFISSRCLKLYPYCYRTATAKNRRGNPTSHVVFYSGFSDKHQMFIQSKNDGCRFRLRCWLPVQVCSFGALVGPNPSSQDLLHGYDSVSYRVPIAHIIGSIFHHCVCVCVCVFVCVCVCVCVFIHIYTYTTAPPRPPAPSPVTRVGVSLSFASPVPSCP